MQAELPVQKNKNRKHNQGRIKMREKILTYIEKNSRISLKELAVIMGVDEVVVAQELNNRV